MNTIRSSMIFIAVVGLACSARTQDTTEDCYELNPDPGAQEWSVDLVCGAPFGERPETPRGVDGEGPFHVGYCEPAEADGSCSSCPADDVNDRVEAHLLEVMAKDSYCDPPYVSHIIPACVTTPAQGSNTGCCYEAYYWGACNIKE